MQDQASSELEHPNTWCCGVREEPWACSGASGATLHVCKPLSSSHFLVNDADHTMFEGKAPRSTPEILIFRSKLCEKMVSTQYPHHSRHHAQHYSKHFSATAWWQETQASTVFCHALYAQWATHIGLLHRVQSQLQRPGLNWSGKWLFELLSLSVPITHHQILLPMQTRLVSTFSCPCGNKQVQIVGKEKCQVTLRMASTAFRDLRSQVTPSWEMSPIHSKPTLFL